jgi:hypothetical protein
MYNLTKQITNYTLDGHIKNVVSEVVMTTDNLRAAFEKRASFPFMEWQSSSMITYGVFTEDGTQVFLDTLYEQEVDQEVFAAQLADENFSINLDEWMRNSMKPG